MPAEWEPHEATWIAWPHNRDDWPGRFAPIPWVYGEIVRKLSAVERVRILVRDRGLAQQARAGAAQGRRGDGSGGVFRVPHQSRLDARFRPAVREEPRAAKWRSRGWRFNAWAKYDDWRTGRAGAGMSSRGA